MTDALLDALRANYVLPPSQKFWFWMVEDRPPPSIADVQIAVVEHFGLTKSDLLSRRRAKQVANARILGMYLCRVLTHRPHDFIAKRFNKCDHSISISGCRRAEFLIKTDPQFAKDFATLNARFA